MESTLQHIFTLVITAEFMLGNLSNGFIVLINCTDWVNKRKLFLVDRILVILAISRIGLIWVILVNWFATLYHPALYVAATQLRLLIFTWAVANHFSLWLATILSIFYLLKIAGFSSPTFLYLQWRIKKVILMILLGSLIFLILNLIQMNTYIKDWVAGFERNTTRNFKMSDFETFSQLVRFTMSMFAVIPFTVALIAFLLLIFSLWKHLQKIQLSFKGHRDPRTRAHINALKAVILFLLLYTTFFLSFLISWIAKTYQTKPVHMLCQTIGFIYPSIHSFVLILGNSKLRQAYLGVAAKMWAIR
ncbi:PREDICTED: taste receptor type 2 member 13-like [Propithecus coquereli]|uniref:taste receptor type 2 member 13-like n=1 Tax=Propithecus coquereli TaxID=379532 RepID=UPI00063F68A2|nr:PREDICTED: taste receptor type 2 member 13-like [Propithecus coquereli]